MSYNVKLMVKVSNLYYKDSLTQDEISKRLKISKYQVNRILKRAVSSGIVQINIIDPTVSISNLENDLEKRFGLKRAIVVENYGLSNIELKAKLGAAVASYLLEIGRDVRRNSNESSLLHRYCRATFPEFRGMVLPCSRT